MPSNHEKQLIPHTTTIGTGLESLLYVEKYVNLKGMPEALEPTGDNIRTFMLALEEEIHEFGRELNWRPWHEGKPVDKMKAIKEYTDMMAFIALLGNHLMEITGASPMEIATVFINTSLNNIRLLREKRGLPVDE